MLLQNDRKLYVIKVESKNLTEGLGIATLTRRAKC